MTKQVLSGIKRPTYTNNTTQNVRIIINYMESLSRYRVDSTRVSGIPNGTIVDSDDPRLGGRNLTSIYEITLNWAGVSVSNSNREPRSTFDSQPFGPFAIGKSLATYIIKSSSGGGGTTFIGGATDGTGAPLQEIAVGGGVALAVVSNNAYSSGGMTVLLPTEILLAPGQTFSAVCGKHNIIAIPENG